MSLPKLAVSKYSLKLPSSGQELKFRPFLVKEEKILLMAMQSGSQKDILEGFKEIIRSCVDGDIDVDQLPMFDIEYLFLQLRARSVGDVIPITYSIEAIKCKTDETPCTFSTEVKIDDIQVAKDPKHKDLIDLDKNIKVKMKYPQMDMTADLVGVQGTDLIESTFKKIADCIEYVMEGVEIHKASDYTEAEMDEFVNTLSSEQFKKLQVFFDTMPKLQKDIESKCSKCGNTHKRVLEGMADFFV